MRIRFFFLLFLLPCIVLINGNDVTSVSKINPPHFNILLITIDTIRPDRISCYSTKYLQTANIDSVAQKGIVFTYAFANTPLTLPSHVSILLGLTPVSHGVHDNSKFRVKEEFLTLAEYLKNKRYATGAFVGAFPLDSRFGLTQGFDVYDDNYGTKAKEEFSYIERKAEKVIQVALDWLKKQHSKWFVWIHLWDPHQPYLPPEPFKTKFKNDLYSGEVAYVDFEIGKLFQYLKNKNLFQNTFIIITGDHGESLGEHGESTHGYFAYNSALWVPLIMSGPGIKPSRINDYVSHIDIFPTICEYLNGEKPPSLQGASLLPLIQGKKLKKRKIYFESLYPYYNRGWAPLRGFIEENDKFIDSPIPEFFNLNDDFNENTNLASKMSLEKYRKELQELEDSLSSSSNTSNTQKIDPETMEKLKSLGYLSAPTPQPKKTYGPEDDLKTLLPLQEKLTKAMGLYHHRKIEDAKKMLNEILEKRKDFDLAYSYLSTMYKEEGKLVEALKVLKSGFENNPYSYSIITAYGILLTESGLHDEAISVLQKGLTLWDYDPEMWNYLGVAYWGKDDYQKALEAYQKALALDNNYAIVFNNLGSLYLSIFIKTNKQDACNQAIECFKKAIKLDPELPSAYNGLGGVYKKTGKIEEAITCWKKSLELKPNYDFPIFNLGIAYLEKGDKATALTYFEKYLSIKNNTLSSQERKKIETLIQECK